MPNEPIAHLVWLQGRRAPDDVEDYYEVARPGDKSVDGSDPFPVYKASSLPLNDVFSVTDVGNSITLHFSEIKSAKAFRAIFSPSQPEPTPHPVDAERHEVAVPKAWIAEGPGWGRVFIEKEAAEKLAAQGGTLKPLYTHPPAAVQEPVAVKVKPLEWRKEIPYHVARVFGNLYVIEVTDGFIALSGIGGRRYFPNFEAAKAFAQSDYEAKIRSALSTSQSDPAPEIATSPKIFCAKLTAGVCDLSERLASSKVEIAALRAENKLGFMPKFRLGERVSKTKGSSWNGPVVGFYSTSMTPCGYVIESDREPGSCQLYPEAALGRVVAPEQEESGS